MPAYDAAGFEPPAPVARVLVRTATGTSAADIQMLIDTGADTTVVPRAVLDHLDAAARPSSVVLQMFDGTRRSAEVADLRIDLLRYTFRGTFVVVDAELGVLGRDVLNQLVLILNGPHLEWSVSGP